MFKIIELIAGKELNPQDFMALLYIFLLFSILIMFVGTILGVAIIVKLIAVML